MCQKEHLFPPDAHKAQHTSSFQGASLLLCCLTQCDSFPPQMKPKGEVCRPPSGECDLAEYCNGTSPVCEEDFFILDGHPCGQDKWICLNGSCQDGEKQCRDLFGYGIFNHLTFPFKHFLGAEKKQMSLFCLFCGT